MTELTRMCKPLLSQSFFLFGARGVGKSTFLRLFFANYRILVFDFLDSNIEENFALRPESFREAVLAQEGHFDWIVIDEVQKIPKILNAVHKLIFEKGFKFALTGSSARRLKQKGVNLLAGRALTQFMFPLSFVELNKDFSIFQILKFGTLPQCYLMTDSEQKRQYLRSYALNYLQIEIQAEQWVRNMDPFRKFLQIAAQMNGKSINFSLLARDAGVDANTIQNYFEILEDTLVCTRLPSFQRSVRKQQRQAPKFYFFDLGVKRALDKTLEVELVEGTSAFGDAFEHFVILEFLRLGAMLKPDWSFSYLQTKDGAEIDLIVTRPGQAEVLIEIKSKALVYPEDARHLFHFESDFPGADLLLLSRQEQALKMENVWALSWREGISRIFEIAK